MIISPAKKMREDTDSFPCQQLPQFLPRTERLMERLRGMSFPELKALWKCSDQLAEFNRERLARMELRRGLTPALIAYEGIQYRYMAPGVFTQEELAYVAGHLRIVSGFYGLLRPFDGVTPYRLEMGARLTVDGAKDLYGFWGPSLAEVLARGEMVRYLAQCREEDPEAVRGFDRLGYRFRPDRSTETTYVFVKEA